VDLVLINIELTKTKIKKGDEKPGSYNSPPLTSIKTIITSLHRKSKL
jgi:hypothetical protein